MGESEKGNTLYMEYHWSNKPSKCFNCCIDDNFEISDVITMWKINIIVHNMFWDNYIYSLGIGHNHTHHDILKLIFKTFIAISQRWDLPQ